MKIVQSMLDAVMAHIAHKIRQHVIDVSSFSHPFVDDRPGEMVT